MHRKSILLQGAFSWSIMRDIMDTLAKLFGGQPRVKIMRLFLLNSNTDFELEEITSRSRVAKATARKEVNALIGIGFIKHKFIQREGSRGAKKKISAWHLNLGFQYLASIQELLVNPSILLQEDLLERFKPIGKIKLLVVSGVFIGDSKSRVDVLLVCDKLNKTVLNQIVKGLEAEIGKELDYVVFDSNEFKYRLDMYDKLVCDVIDLPHKKLIDLDQLSTYISKK
jgi:hypothetical protein